MKNLVLIIATVLVSLTASSQSVLNEYEIRPNIEGGNIGEKIRHINTDGSVIFLYEGLFTYDEAALILKEAQLIIDEFATGNEHGLSPEDLIDSVNPVDPEDSAAFDYNFPNGEFMQISSQNMGSTTIKYVRLIFKPDGDK